NPGLASGLWEVVTHLPGLRAWWYGWRLMDSTPRVTDAEFTVIEEPRPEPIPPWWRRWSVGRYQGLLEFETAGLRWAYDWKFALIVVLITVAGWLGRSHLPPLH
ncbi:MAG: hypothetical protein KBD40_12185, partial [Phenylobacterium sp.]|nr:hypothetical protein [Phenylobacterium sp.]